MGGARHRGGATRARADRPGPRGRRSLFETGLSLVGYQLTDAFRTGTAPGRYGTAFPLIAPYEVFPTQDGELMIAAANDGLFVQLCERIGLPELAEDPRFRTNPDRLANRDALLPPIRARLAEQPSAHWLDALEGIPVAPVQDIAQAAAHEQTRAVGIVQELAGMETLALPLEIDCERVGHHDAPPTLGAHSADVLAELGYSRGRDRRARRRGRDAARVESRHDRPPAEDRLRRPQLPRPRGGAGRRPARAAAPLREVAEHADRLRRADPRAGICKNPDYEAELGVVIGRRASRVSIDDALDFVRGYVVANDVSGRDIQFSDGQWVRGKTLDTFLPVGDLVPASEVPDPQALPIRAILNGDDDAGLEHVEPDLRRRRGDRVRRRRRSRSSPAT